MSDCYHCRSMRRNLPECSAGCPHRTLRVDDIFEMKVGEEYDGGVIVTVNREHRTVTLEPPDIYFSEGRWK